MRTIYIDTLFFINLIANYFLLLGTAKICGIAALRRRLWLGAALGGVYAVLCALPPAAFLSHALFYVIAAAAMLLIAFGKKHLGARRRLLRIALVFFALSMCAAGAVTAISLLGSNGRLGPVSLRVLIIAFGVCYIAAALVFRRAGRAPGRMSEIKVEVGSRAVALRALIDTGNSLTDPLSGSRVCVACVSDMLPLIPDDLKLRFEDAVRSGSPNALLALNRAPSGIKFRLIPYSAVGVKSGMLLGFRPDRISVDGEEARDLVVAVSPNEVADNVTYSALI